MKNEEIRASLETVITNLENMSPTTPVTDSLDILRPIVMSLGGKVPFTREQATRLTLLRAKRDATLSPAEAVELAGLEANVLEPLSTTTSGTTPVGTVLTSSGTVSETVIGTASIGTADSGTAGSVVGVGTAVTPNGIVVGTIQGTPSVGTLPGTTVGTTPATPAGTPPVR